MLDHSNRHAHQLQANALVIYGGQSLQRAVQMYKLLVKHQLLRVITKSCKMLHEKSCLIINMPKIMIIKHQQFAKTNTFSLSFHILFSPFFHIFPHFPQDTSKSGFGDGQKWGWTPPKLFVYFAILHFLIEWSIYLNSRTKLRQIKYAVYCTLGIAQKSRIILRTELQVPYRSGINGAKFQRKIMTATPRQMPFYVCT